MRIAPLKEATEIKARYLPKDRVALAWADRRITWRELNDRVDRLASALHGLGLRKGEPCAFLFHNRPEFVESTLAVQALGAVPVPVNFRYVSNEVLYVLNNCDTRFFLFEQEALELLDGIRAELPRVQHYICKGAAAPAGMHSYEALIQGHGPHYPRVPVDPDDTAVIIYTGGTTGQPKGVMLSYENFRSNQEAIIAYLIMLLPPVEELPLPVFARNELQRKVLNALSHLATPLAAVFKGAGTVPPVVALDLLSTSGIAIPPLTVTVRQGRIKIFQGTADRCDLRVRITMGQEFRKFVELSVYPYSLRGRVAVLPQLARLLASGALRVEGRPAYRLKMILSTFSPPAEEEVENILLVPPMFHLASFAFWLTFWLYQKGQVTFPGSAEFNPNEVLETIERESISWIFLVPTMWKRLLAALEQRRYRLDSVRVALTGAALMPGKYKRLILEHFPNALLLDGFGQTEMAPVTTFKVDAEPETVKDRSVGALLEGIEARIVDEHGEEVPDGQVGELWYRGKSVMKGYYKDESKTRQVLSADGWFHSGDLAYRGPDGEIYTVERKTECINSGGEKIYPLEVEEILLKHPKVDEVCVIGAQDEDLGEAVRAVIVPKKGEHPTEEEIVQWCKGKMAGYKKPRSVVFVERLPLSPVGKILRAKIKERYGGPPPFRASAD